MIGSMVVVVGYVSFIIQCIAGTLIEPIGHETCIMIDKDFLVVDKILSYDMDVKEPHLSLIHLSICRQDLPLLSLPLVKIQTIGLYKFRGEARGVPPTPSSTSNSVMYLLPQYKK